MSITSTEARITLAREWPHPIAIGDGQVLANKLFVDQEGYWTGDQVTLSCVRGLPFDIAGGGFADCPEGHRFWGGLGVAGPVTAHRSNDGAAFWNASDGAAFWEASATTGLTQQTSAFLRRDDLNRCTFYTTELQALNGGATGLIALVPVAFGNLVIANRSADATYTALLASAAAAVDGLELVGGWQSIDEIDDTKALAVSIAVIAADAEFRGWRVLCGLSEMLFDDDADNLDGTAIGELFGSSVPAVATGQGSFRGDLSNDWATGEDSALMMLRLLRLRQKGAAATMRYQIANSRIVGGSRQEFPIYYQTRILFGKTTVGVSAGKFTTFSGDFVSTGEIKIVTDAAS